MLRLESLKCAHGVASSYTHSSPHTWLRTVQVAFLPSRIYLFHRGLPFHHGDMHWSIVTSCVGSCLKVFCSAARLALLRVCFRFFRSTLTRHCHGCLPLPWLPAMAAGHGCWPWPWPLAHDLAPPPPQSSPALKGPPPQHNTLLNAYFKRKNWGRLNSFEK